ncbi:MAG TPA: hypothetical protein VNG33_13870 [Polyangiaceae bacterium]|nr:hypothetical protein [Polyangiaceae bacterium]
MTACSDNAAAAAQGAAGMLGASGQTTTAGAPSSAGSSGAAGGNSASGSSTGGAGGGSGLSVGGTVDGGSAGTAGGSGGTSAAGGGSGGSGGSNSNGGVPAASGSGGGGGSPSFSCTLVIGCFQTSQWYGAGFEATVGTDKWEIKADHNTFTENWANPTDAFWNLPIASPCAKDQSLPDRVLFISYSKTLTTEDAWETQLSQVIANVKTKFPSVKQVDLLGMVRAPNNVMCANNNNPSTIVKPEQDQALQAVADKSAGMVKVGPKYFAPSCDSFVTNNTNLTDAAAAAIAPTLSAFYK